MHPQPVEVHKALLQIGRVHALSLSDCSVFMFDTQHTKARQPHHVMGAWRGHMVPLCSARLPWWRKVGAHYARSRHAQLACRVLHSTVQVPHCEGGLDIWRTWLRRGSNPQSVRPWVATSAMWPPMATLPLHLSYRCRLPWTVRSLHSTVQVPHSVRITVCSSVACF